MPTHDVGLLGAARVTCRGRAGARPGTTRAGASPTRPAKPALHPRGDDVVVDVAGRRHHHRRRAVAGLEVRPDLLRRHLGDRAALAEHLPPQRVVREERLVEDLVHQVGRLVLVHVDLFEDDLALGLDLVRAERRRPHDVAEDVEAQLEVLVDQAGVEGRVLLGGEGVHVAADRVDGLGDVAGAAGVGALEQQVLEEVRGPPLGRRLVARAGVHPERQGGRVGVRHLLGDDLDAVVQAGAPDRHTVRPVELSDCGI